jgi:GNAT superfamily N-acetyltransferase
MVIEKKEIQASKGIKFSAMIDGKEVGRAFLFILKNDFRNREYGFLEDVMVDESCRGQGIGTKLLNELIATAKELKLYKLICTSRKGRKEVHALYEKLGLKNWGIEFKMYLEDLD